VAYNFTRRKPREANEHQLYYFASMDMGVSHTLSRHFFWSENVLWKKDLGDRRTTVSLAERDLIVDTVAVGRYLSTGSKPGDDELNGNGNGTNDGVLIDLGDDDDENTGMRLRGGEGLQPDLDDEEWKSRKWRGKGIDVLWFKDLDHAQVFDKPSSRARLIQAIRTYCADRT